VARGQIRREKEENPSTGEEAMSFTEDWKIT